MRKPEAPPVEFQQLVDLVCHQTLDAEQAARLEQAVIDDPACREYYVTYLSMHSAIGSTVSVDAASHRSSGSHRGVRPKSRVLGLLVYSLPEAIHPERHRAAFLVAATLLTTIFCGMLLLVIWLSGGLGGSPRQGQSGFVATLTHTKKVVWAKGQTEIVLGSRLVAGDRLELEHGLVHLLFRNGARVVVEGPAKFRVDTIGAVTLEEGRLLAQVSQQARGFTVETPTVDLVDLGTEFGVNVAEEETEVQVFEGKVQSYRHDDAEDQGRTLTAGQATVFGNSPQLGFYVKEKKMNRAIYLSLATVLAVSSPDRASAGFIDIASIVGIGDTVINSTNNAGTDDGFPFGPESAVRDEGLLINGNPSGSPLSQSAVGVNNNYWNSGAYGSATGGMLIDLGQTYHLDAIQLYGYNISGTGGSFSDRSLGSFTIWTATDSSAVTTSGGSLLVNNLGLFTQQGASQTMADPSELATLGETYLFGGASQPSEVGGIVHNVTGTSVSARYLFFRDMLGQSDNSETVVGLGEIRVYGTVPPPVPEPMTDTLLGLGGMMVLGFTRRRRRRVCIKVR